MRALGHDFFKVADKAVWEAQQTELKQKTQQRIKRLLEIVEEIGEPSITNIGAEAAQAVSVLALHDGSVALKKILTAFNQLYARDKADCYYQAIPSMTDLLLILEGKPQRFGTQWLFDANKQPFLPTVADFDHVNERRTAYGIEPLRWPKSLAIPESEQPWLTRPLSELIMRDPTEEELDRLK